VCLTPDRYVGRTGKLICGLFSWHEQFTRLNLKRGGNFSDAPHRYVPDATIDRRNIGAVQDASERQVFLRKRLLTPNAPKILHKDLSQILLFWGLPSTGCTFCRQSWLRKGCLLDIRRGDGRSVGLTPRPSQVRSAYPVAWQFRGLPMPNVFTVKPTTHGQQQEPTTVPGCIANSTKRCL